MNIRTYFLIIVSGITIFCNSSFSQITSAGSGNWSSPGTWAGSVVPDSTQNVVIALGHTITIDDGTAACNSISFSDTSSHLVMGFSSSVLSVYGNFTIFSTLHKVFLYNAWPTGAKIKFTGGAATQTLSGWSTTASSTIFTEIIVDKWNGKVVTTGTNIRFSWGTSFDINNGTFELASTDDLESRNLAGTAIQGYITIQPKGVFLMDGGGSHIRSGTLLTDTLLSRIGKMTVYGIARLSSSSTNRLNIGGIDIMSGGKDTLDSGWGTNNFNCGKITVYDGGTIINSGTTNLWHATALVEVQSGGEFNANSSTTPIPTYFVNNGTMRFSRSSIAQTLPAEVTTYNNLFFSGALTKTLSSSITVNGTLEFLGTASLVLNGFSLTYGPSAELQYGASGQLSAQTTADAEWPASNGPRNVQIYNSGGVTLHANRTINGTLTLSLGVFDNNGSANDKTLTLADGSTIKRARGIFTTAPSFAGTVNLEYSSTVVSDTTSFEIPSSSSALNNLSISSTQGVTLGSNVTVNGTLTLSGSNLLLGDYNLTAASITGGSTSSYVVTDGTGGLIRNVSSGDVSFPVGYTDTYTPVVLNNSGDPDNFTVNVKNTFDNSPITSQVVNKQWTITEGTPGGSNAIVKLQWNTADENPAFIRTSPIYIGRYNGSAWEQTGASYTDLTGGVYTASAVGFTAFSPFGIGNSGALPVELSSFASNMNGRNIQLNWETKTEINFNKFEIDRALVNTKDASITWSYIGIVQASGTINSPRQYSFTDKNLQAGKYQYRLKMVDNDGSFKYSKIVETEISLPKNFTLNQNYPNPFNPTTNIRFEIPKASDVNISVYNIVGQKVATLLNEYMEAGYYQRSFSSNYNGVSLSSGTYFYILKAGDNKIVKKMILMK